MATKNLALVTGANGHLGNNLVRALLQKGIPVRASVRNIKNRTPFEGLDCELVQADMTDKASMGAALQNVEVFYAVGAVFKLWAQNPKAEIYDVNLAGIQNMIEAAAEAGVQKIVYVSSIAALNYNATPIDENSGFNSDRRDWYYNSKNDGEKLAFELAKKHGIPLVAVLPSAMIGGVAFKPLSTSYNFIDMVLEKKIPVETNMAINWIDVKDVAEGCYLAAIKGQNGERYILASPKSISITGTTQIAQKLFPGLRIKMPVPVPKTVLYLMAGCMDLVSKITGKAPSLSVKDVNMFYGLQPDFDISKARTELGFQPKPALEAVQDAMRYLKNMA
jgi:dihydroflavonol-4-reductase